MSFIPYGKQNISDDDIAAVVAVLRSDFLTQGPVVPEFEKAVAAYCGAKHGVAVNSATSALHIACMALGVGPGDMVWTTPITFVASANCARYCGADVDFVDIDPRTHNMSIASLTEKLEKAQRDGRLPKVVIPVHLSGQSCEMQAIHELSKQYGFRTIEDASHAIGGSYQGQKVGDCRFSDIVVFSFHPVKIITTGEGGMCVTNDIELAKHMARLRSHGITRYPAEMTHPPDGPWYYQQIELGFNYRLTDLHAALGLSQLAQIDSFVTQRHAIAKRYDELLDGSVVKTPWQHPDTYSGLHLYVIRLKLDAVKTTHREVFERMRADGIGVNLHYIPVYRQPYYERMGFNPADFPNAEAYYAEAITLPIFPGFTPAQQDEVVRRLLKPSGYQTIF
ncbi:UDP-4-amino-4,6-dideoxy-N-acetyl-beta-L-altrosamine transaminase [Hydrogenophaga sp. BPS33]|uniref:UDP-4-amino-4, 6-dideoxy-N-acetyl-beta-L-altrosamine transaminase n=1 Tax=Hydrogenophaga sp. BPS33 TaxID=2651974 RepID=UPI00131FFF7C|nr:UDP-4-amino-4,6-dideoxy-N-acetyl-beta-L-altrosamine transaminase [Hydrogenophaga sp. BPS33]QHE83771.1 UDP-4-amino-4,6-dideoxy-N-acetyl-beta-L-altrosamine transaminase [Hydrogenophaga sp. BPS33]